MPQLDLLTFSSQNFWFLITFLLAFVIVCSTMVNETRTALSLFNSMSNATLKSDNEAILKKKALSWNLLQ